MITIDCVTKTQILSIFHFADNFQNNEIVEKSCKDKILCNAFFESSTRTSMSFECAMLKLGGNVIHFNSSTSSIKKGETCNDTLKTIQEFCDIIVLRHPDEKFIHSAKSICKVPIINGGNGCGEHPTQAILDLYTMQRYVDINDTFEICLVGDLKYSRTINSLVDLFLKMGIQCNITICCYHGCNPDESLIEKLNKFSFKSVNCLDNHIHKFDVIYCTRHQKERHIEQLCNISDEMCKWQINDQNINRMKQNAIILHPLPRNNEITQNVDNDCRAKYFDQVKNGIYIRMAILHTLLNPSSDNIAGADLEN